PAGGGAGRARRADGARPPSPRQPEDALGDQVALDRGGPAHDRLRAGVEVGAAALLVEHRPRPEHLHRQLLEALVGLAAEHLLDRALDPRLPRAHEARQAPVADQAEQLHLDVRLREPLAVSRVGERPPGGGMRARVAEQALEAPPDRALEGEGPHRPALVREDAHRDLPAGAGRAHHHLGRHAHVLEENLRELRLARDLLQGAHGDARAPHVDQEETQAVVLGRFGLGAAEEEAPVGDVGVAGPHLLAVHDEAVAPALAARAERAQVRARAGLGEALAPEVLAREEPGEEARALRLGAVAQDDRPDQVDVGAGGGPRRARAPRTRSPRPPGSIRVRFLTQLPGPAKRRAVPSEPQPADRYVRVGDLRFHYLDFGGGGPPLLFLHATGFHAWLWLPYARRFAASHRVLALDQRGHGESDKPPTGYGWDTFGTDVKGFLDALGLDGVRAVGHSKGATAIAAAAAAGTRRLARAVLIEPVLISAAPRTEPAWENPLAAAARKRRNAWPSRGPRLRRARGRRGDPPPAGGHAAHRRARRPLRADGAPGRGERRGRRLPRLSPRARAKGPNDHGGGPPFPHRGRRPRALPPVLLMS